MKKKRLIYTSLAALVLATLGTESVLAQGAVESVEPPKDSKAEQPREQQLAEEVKVLDEQIEAITLERDGLAQHVDVVAYNQVVAKTEELVNLATKLKTELGVTHEGQVISEQEKVAAQIDGLTAAQTSANAQELLARQDHLDQVATGLEKDKVTKESELGKIQEAVKAQEADKKRLEEEKTKQEAERVGVASQKESVDKDIEELTAKLAGKDFVESRVLSRVDTSAIVEARRERHHVFGAGTALEGKVDSSGRFVPSETGELMEDIKYSGATEEAIINAAHPYVPNDAALSKHVVDYINQLRLLNGLPATVQVTPTAQKNAIEWAIKHAEENSKTPSVMDTRLFHREGYPYEENLMYYLPLSVNSDREMAYLLVLDWFADYLNASPLEGVGYYGHRATLLANVPDFAVATRKDAKGVYYFVLNSSVAEGGKTDRFNLVSASSGKGVDTKLQLGGKDMVFLPRTTFVYRTEGESRQDVTNLLLAKQEESKLLGGRLSDIVAMIEKKQEEIVDATAVVNARRREEQDVYSAIRALDKKIEANRTERRDVANDLDKIGYNKDRLVGLRDRSARLRRLSTHLEEIARLEGEKATLQSRYDALSGRHLYLTNQLAELTKKRQGVKELLGAFHLKEEVLKGPSTNLGVGAGVGAGSEKGPAKGSLKGPAKAAGASQAPGAAKAPVTSQSVAVVATGNTAKNLPNTGDVVGLMTLGAGGFLSSLGLLGLKRRRKV